MLVRRYGDFAAAEDAVQEALLAAALHWPRDGWPDNPRAAGLSLVDSLDERLLGHYRWDAVRAHLHEMRGDPAQAAAHYRAAAARTTNEPERRYLTGQAARLRHSPSPDAPDLGR